jgi:hypothetical protein
LQLLRKVLQVGFLPVVMADGNPIAIAVNIDELVAERLVGLAAEVIVSGEINASRAGPGCSGSAGAARLSSASINNGKHQMCTQDHIESPAHQPPKNMLYPSRTAHSSAIPA